MLGHFPAAIDDRGCGPFRETGVYGMPPPREAVLRLDSRSKRHRSQRCRTASRARTRPSGVRGPVLSPPCRLQRPLRMSPVRRSRAGRRMHGRPVCLPRAPQGAAYRGDRRSAEVRHPFEEVLAAAPTPTDEDAGRGVEAARRGAIARSGCPRRSSDFRTRTRARTARRRSRAGPSCMSGATSSRNRARGNRPWGASSSPAEASKPSVCLNRPRRTVSSDSV